MENNDFEYKLPHLKETKYVPINQKNVTKLKPEDENKKLETLFLYFTVLVATLPVLSTGAGVAWTSSAVVKLQSNESNINPIGRPITTTELSMFMGVPALVAIAGSSMLPRLADLVGRKSSLQLLSFISFMSIVGLAFSYNMNIINVCNSLVATFTIGVNNILPIYIMEIAEDRNRAKFGCFLSVLFPVGELCSYTIGPYFSYRDFTLITAIPFIPFILIFFLVPESPVYSLSRGRKEECKKALKKFRSSKTSEELDLECIEIQKNLKPTEQNGGNKFLKLFSSKEAKIGVMLGALPSLVQLFCGIPIVMSLLTPIFNESGSNLSGDTIAIIIGVTKVCTTIFTSLVVEKFGRKYMLVTSSVGMGVGVSILGTFFYLKYINSPIVPHFRWVPLVSMMAYVISFALGIGSITNVLVGELFTSELRTTAFGFMSTSIGLLSVVYSTGYPLVAESVGIYWCMWIFAASCFIGGLFMAVLLPETKGKSIIEIQEMLKRY